MSIPLPPDALHAYAVAPASLVAVATIRLDPADLLLNNAEIRRKDVVLVTGPDTLGPLLALMRHGCDTATAVHPGTPCRATAPVDVLWVTGAASLNETAASIARLSHPRLVILETGPADSRALDAVLDAKGLTDRRRETVNGRAVLIATRPPAS